MRSALPVQYEKNVSLLEFLAKSGAFGVECTWKMEKFLRSFPATRVRLTGVKLGSR